jgi:excinuclease ABC subunit B
MALDNRPLKFDEWNTRRGQTIFVSATPADWELDEAEGEFVEQIIRPTGLVDPEVHVHSARGQVAHLMEQIKARAARGERTLVTTLTKRLSEDLVGYLKEENIRCEWLHSELDAIERVEVLRELREGRFDAVVGVNLLREGLDLPEVSLVCILDADKEGFLRSETSLIQTIGRSARNVNAEVILYADQVTDSMQRAIDETNRRRQRQLQYNAEHGITPESIKKAIRRGIEDEIAARKIERTASGKQDEAGFVTQEFLAELEAEMLKAAEELDFERAAQLRDRIMQLKWHASRTVEEGPAMNSNAARALDKLQPRGRKGRRGGKGRVPRPRNVDP